MDQRTIHQGHPPFGLKSRPTGCHSLIDDTLPLLLYVDRSVYAALASCICTLYAVQLSKTWQQMPTPKHARADMGGQQGSSGQRQPFQLTEAVERESNGVDSEALQQYRAIDWGNPTEADMWVAAAAGVSSPSPLSASQQADAYRSSAGRSRSWLPQWHLQGLHKRGRKAMIGACMQALRDIVVCMPEGASFTPEETLVRTADTVVAIAACNACQACLGYVPEALFRATTALFDSLTAPSHHHDSSAGSNHREESEAVEYSVDSSLDASRRSAAGAGELALWLKGAWCCTHDSLRDQNQQSSQESSLGTPISSDSSADNSLHSHSEERSSAAGVGWGTVTADIPRKHSTGASESSGMFQSSEISLPREQRHVEAGTPGKKKLNAWARRLRADKAPETTAAGEPGANTFPGLATGKGAAHAMMLRCILQLRGGAQSGSQPADSYANLNSRSNMHEPEPSRTLYSSSHGGLDSSEETGALDSVTKGRRGGMHERVSAAAGSVQKGKRSGIGARDAQVPAQIFRNVPALLQDMVLCAAEACAAAYMDDVRNGTVPALHRRVQAAPVVPQAERGAAWEDSWTLQTAMVEVPALLDKRLGTTRELERFRNHLAIASAVQHKYGRVRDIYEDRYTLQAVGDGHRLFTRRLFIRRTHELNALEGWQARLSTAMELGDVVAPVVVRLLQRLSRLLSWLLVSLVGGGLGLIYKGIRQSMTGSGKRRPGDAGWDFNIGGKNNRRSQNDVEEPEYGFDFF